MNNSPTKPTPQQADQQQSNQERPNQQQANQQQSDQEQSDQQESEQTFSTPFGKYFRYLNKIDKGKRYSKEYGSIMILSLVEEIGEMSRAYLAEHGRKKSNLAAQLDETYQQELGDILLTILRFARIKKINLDERLMYSLRKIEQRKDNPKR